MSPRERISAAIRDARTGTAIVGFITAGYPSREKFREHLTQVGNEADVVEIFIALEAAGAHAKKSNAVAVLGIEVGVDLKDKATKLVFADGYRALVCFAVPGGGCNAHKGVEHFLYPKVVDSTAKEYRGDIAS